MTIDAEDMFRITREVTLGQEPATPDTPAQAKFRREVRPEVEEIRKAGGIVDVPFETPSLADLPRE